MIVGNPEKKENGLAAYQEKKWLVGLVLKFLKDTKVVNKKAVSDRKLK